jgi:hypothetical protein
MSFVLSGCDKESGETDATADAGSEKACSEVVERTECEAMRECSFGAANSEITMEAGVCNDMKFTNVDAPAGFCATEPVSGSAVGSIWYHVETGRTFAFGIDPGSQGVPGWEPCLCEEGEAVACACTDEC